jgi:hypothetical protein
LFINTKRKSGELLRNPYMLTRELLRIMQHFMAISEMETTTDIETETEKY